MLFLVYCTDKPGSLDVRMANRADHIEWLKARGDRLKAGGPWMNDAGEMAGSLLIVDADDAHELSTWLAEDPYAKAGLFNRVETRPYKWVFHTAPDLG